VKRHRRPAPTAGRSWSRSRSNGRPERCPGHRADRV